MKALLTKIWNTAKALFLRSKTLFAAAILGAIGLVDQLELIPGFDLMSIIKFLIHDEAKAGSVVAAVSMLFGVLRFLTSSGLLTFGAKQAETSSGIDVPDEADAALEQ